jgi:hypothetical protein
VLNKKATGRNSPREIAPVAQKYANQYWSNVKSEQPNQTCCENTLISYTLPGQPGGAFFF